MNTPQERANAIQLALKMLEGVDFKFADTKLAATTKVADEILKYIEGSDIIEYHDGELEMRNTVKGQQRIIPIVEQLDNCGKCHNPHVIDATYDHEFVVTEEPEPAPKPKDPLKCARCGMKENNFHHDSSAQGHGGHKFEAPLG
jgi:hypothetical protein